MDENKFIEQIHRRIAQISIGSSAIRNQGAPGLIKICHNYLFSDISLKEFREKLPTDEYYIYLDKKTTELRSLFPKNGKSWGAARKGLNLFFREVIYNSYLSDYLEIPCDFNDNLQIIRNLEVPLDKHVAIELINIYNEIPEIIISKIPPKWVSIKALRKPQSQVFQNIARNYADRQNTARVHLDLEFWRKEKTK